MSLLRHLALSAAALAAAVAAAPAMAETKLDFILN